MLATELRWARGECGLDTVSHGKRVQLLPVSREFCLFFLPERRATAVSLSILGPFTIGNGRQISPQGRSGCGSVASLARQRMREGKGGAGRFPWETV